MKRLIHECRRRLAVLLAAVELHQLKHDVVDGRRVIVKRRNALSRLGIPLGNGILHLIGAESRVLPEAEWRAWEETVASAASLPEGVMAPLHSGRTLDVILQGDRRRGESDWSDAKEHAVRLAARALQQLHARTVVSPLGPWRLSHGDATVENVCVDLENDAAVWFDFDTRHLLDLSWRRRRADDLRAFLYSAASFLSPSAHQQLAKLSTVLAETPAQCTELRDCIQGPWRKPSLFHLAQAPLGWAEQESFSAALDQALPKAQGVAKRNPG